MPKSKVPHPADAFKDLHALPFASMGESDQRWAIWQGIKYLIEGEISRLETKYPRER